MNNRILEFAKHHLVRDEHTEFGWQECHKYEFDPDELEKFAELIIRECADICINKNVSNLDLDIIRESGKFTLQDLATKSCGENLSKQIKEHFGIE